MRTRRGFRAQRAACPSISPVQQCAKRRPTKSLDPWFYWLRRRSGAPEPPCSILASLPTSCDARFGKAARSIPAGSCRSLRSGPAPGGAARARFRRAAHALRRAVRPLRPRGAPPLRRRRRCGFAALPRRSRRRGETCRGRSCPRGGPASGSPLPALPGYS